MKNFLAIIILMGHVKKDKPRDYWSTNIFIQTAILGKLISRNRFERIWNFWHYDDNSALDDEADRLYRIRPVSDNLVENFMRHCKRDDDPMARNPDELAKCGILARKVCEATTGCTGNMETYAAEGKKLEETTLSVLELYLDLRHHVYNCYNSVEIAEKLLLRKTIV
jgi:hypothetical protein